MSFSKFTPNLQLEKQLSKLEENSEQNIISNYKRNLCKSREPADLFIYCLFKGTERSNRSQKKGLP